MTIGLPPKLKVLSRVDASMAAAIAPPAAAKSAASAPLLRPPKDFGNAKRVQRVPGCGVPADSEVPAATAFDLPAARNSTKPACDATIIFPHSTSTINVAG